MLPSLQASVFIADNLFGINWCERNGVFARVTLPKRTYAQGQGKTCMGIRLESLHVISLSGIGSLRSYDGCCNENDTLKYNFSLG